MNDRFKFRCFSKKTKKMYEVDSLHLDSENEWVWVHYYNPIYDKDLKIQIEQPNAIIMQCTGIKDSTGKLIYEGDIIKIPEDWDIYGQFTGEVREVYYNEGFRLKPKWDKNHRGNWLEDTKDFEVIGNIYENKELLESEG